MQASWETYATDLANAPTDEVLVAVYNKLVTDLKIKLDGPARVVFARDTRASGPGLAASLWDGLTAAGAQFTNYGFLTTPQLHYLVHSLNTQGTPISYGAPTEEGYYKKLCTAFTKAMKYRKTTSGVTVDCANGVGAPKLKELVKHLPNSSQGGVDVKIVNDDIHRPEMLNVQVRDILEANSPAEV